MNETTTILLVEDNPDDIELTKRAFEKQNAANKLVVAENGVEALDYLFATGPHSDRDNSIMPSLILLDLKLPQMDGFEVLRRLRADERTKLIPVVVLTSSDQDIDLIESYNLGCNSYLRKPTSFAKFIEDLRTLVSYWLHLNEPPPKTTT